MWSHQQLNVTERCIMENLNYRIMPLCADDCLTDAMVDMQLAAQQPDWELHAYNSPDSASSDDESDENNYIPTHSRSKTLSSGKAILGLGLSLTPVDTPATEISQTTATSRSSKPSNDYF
ncbi:hypothetical protein NM208_g16988 [Fusarium decemcellulare]|uniref:Uncharacterized protein n=1 Tax=Fusarium decemcellulare TaxID=57161 RepID=A0ACC1RBA0_9HYPO|nr:hypothetical protein NM208_g16988 [Fusarium decemcellulare]